jgi:hypothetical protein
MGLRSSGFKKRVKYVVFISAGVWKKEASHADINTACENQ